MLKRREYALTIPALSICLLFAGASSNALASSPKESATGKVSSSCSFEGHQLYGKIQVVDSFPDVKIKLVTSFPDLKVKKVDSFPENCGEWKMVTSFPDTKVQFVNSFPDVEIKYVTSFPGLP